MSHMTYVCSQVCSSGPVVKPAPKSLKRACPLLKCAWPVLKSRLAGAQAGWGQPSGSSSAYPPFKPAGHASQMENIHICLPRGNPLGKQPLFTKGDSR
jgi:hypothetical protein